MSDERIESILGSNEPKSCVLRKHVQRKILGLTIVMRLVELMNSSLYILSEVGLGTDVYFTVDVIAPKGEA